MGVLDNIKNIFKRKEKINESTSAASSVVESEKVIKSLISSNKSFLSSTDISTTDFKKALEIYKIMDNDAVISAALDLYADNSTLVNEKTGHVVAVESSDQIFKEEINKFLWDVVNIDTEAWQLVRDIARDGVIYLDTKGCTDGRLWSFTPVQDPYNIQALTYGQEDVKYYLVSPKENKDEENTYFNLVRDSDGSTDKVVVPSTNYISGFHTRQILGEVSIKSTSLFGKEREEKLLIRSGRSLLAPVVQTWETLCALEDAMFIHRLTKSSSFKIVHVDVSNTTNKQAEQIIASVSNALKSAETIDQTNNKYQSRQSPIPKDDYIFIPRKDGKGGIEISEIGGDVGEVKSAADIEYYRNKLFAGLGVLKAYLGFEETTPGGIGESVLTKLDERFGRKVTRLQQILKSVIKQIVEYYWQFSANDRTLKNIPNFSIVLGKVSTKEEEANMKRLESSLSLANSIISTATSEIFFSFVSKEKLFKYVFEDIIGIKTSMFDNTPAEEDIHVEIKEIEESTKTKDQKKIKVKKEPNVFVVSNIKDIFEDRRNLNAIKDLIDNYNLEIEMPDGTTKNIKEVFYSKNFKDFANLTIKKDPLFEYTYKQLKDMSKQLDPKRLEKAKKINIRYVGLDNQNNITFVATAENPELNKKTGKPTSYVTRINLNALGYVIQANEEDDRQILDRDIVRLALTGDVETSCSCPAAKYWGQQYKGTIQKYSLDKNRIVPTRNLPLQTVCKHTLASLMALPFWTNSIVRDLRDKGVIRKINKKPKKNPKKEEES